MPRNLTETELSLLRLNAQRQVDAQRGRNVKPRVDLPASEVLLALFELQQRRKHKGPKPVSTLTMSLMSMKIGDTLEVPPVSQQVLSGSKRTARKQLAVDARWSSKTTEHGTTELFRLDDGASVCGGRAAGKVTQTISRMHVWDTEKFPNATRLENSFRIRARVLMDEPLAQWRGRKLSTGELEITRVK